MKHFMLSGWWLFPSLLGILASGILSCLLFHALRGKERIRRRIALLERRSSDRLRLIRTLLDLCYSYRNSPQVFLDKFKDSVNIRQLKSYDLIDLNASEYPGLREDEILLCRMIETGFTQRELSVVFNLKKTSYLYVKHRRICKKRIGCGIPAADRDSGGKEHARRT